MIFWIIYAVGFIITFIWSHHEEFKNGKREYWVCWMVSLGWFLVIPLDFVWLSYIEVQKIYDNGGWKEFFKDDEDD